MNDEILFIKPSSARFVTGDENILSLKYRVGARQFFFKPFWRQAYHQAAQFLWLLRKLPAAKLIYVWFADYHAFVPVLMAKVLGKKALIVIGGYDVARLPEYNYGAHLRVFRSFYIRISLRFASMLLPVSHATAQALSAFTSNENVQVVYNGVDAAIYHPRGQILKEKLVVTVCGAQDVRSAKIKGIDCFLQVARRLPGCTFMIIGLEAEAADYVNNLGVPANVTLKGRANQEELVSIYSRASVYCQFSHHESFGVAVAEAMACACVPVVTATGALPELVDDAGWIIPSHDIPALAKAVQCALDVDDEKRQRIRQRIIDHFSLERRQERLDAILQELLER